MFADRERAGEQLAAELADPGIEADLVLAVPRGGLPLGRAVADRLDAPLDVVVASKIGAPNNPEFALGAVAEDGSMWRNDAAIERVGASEEYFARERERERAAAAEKAADYREGERLSVAGKQVVVVDDGVATGATMRACLELVRAEDPERLVLAVPVGPPDALRDLGEIADEVVALERPANFRAVGSHYQRFEQVRDEQAKAYLRD